MAERGQGRRHPRETVVAAVITVAPQLPDDDIAALLQTARVGSGRSLAELATHLSDHPER